MPLGKLLRESQVVGVVDTFFGDSGKGKIVDYLASSGLFSINLRANGGPNTGHTVMAGNKRVIFHLIPSGVLVPGITSVIGRGVCLEPATFFSDYRNTLSINPEAKVYVDGSAHVIMPWHIALDNLREAVRGKENIGTTGKGVGPCMETRDSRIGFVTLEDLLPFSLDLEEKIEAARLTVLPQITELMRRFDSDEQLVKKHSSARGFLSEIGLGNGTNVGDFFRGNDFAVENIINVYAEYGSRLHIHLTDSLALVQNAERRGGRVIIEGSQGVFLDIIHGTYPYVTAGLTTRPGLEHDAGIFIDTCINVVKAYATRVGNGPFPSEIKDEELAGRLREAGREYGATTGRPRRVGWLDMPALKHALSLNCRPNERRLVALTKLDVLKGFEPKIFLDYTDKRDGAYIDFREYKGIEDIGDVKNIEGLPQEAHRYVGNIGELSRAEIVMVGKGPGREEIIL